MKVKNKSITNFIQNEYRSYANYVISKRGIPNVLDSLTPVQRLGILNSPSQFTKTLKVIGDMISSGYHHGDGSAGGAISRLARECQSAEPILINDGFFGNLINLRPASPRYTSLKINPIVKEMIDKYKHLNKYNEDNVILSISTDFPIGLLNTSIGIAVGFASKILPRKKSEIEKYLNKKRANLTPYFKNWKGEIYEDPEIPNRWILVADVTIEDKKITFNSIPPLMNFAKFVSKLESVCKGINNSISINNYSTDVVHVEVNIPPNLEQSEIDYILNCGKLSVTENLTFIFDDKVVEYNKISDYLDDFRLKNEHLYLEDYKYKKDVASLDIEIYEALIKFITFMMDKKRTQNDVDVFISQFKNNIVKNKLDNYKLCNLTIDKKKYFVDKLTEAKKQLAELTELINSYRTTKDDISFVSTRSKINFVENFDDDIEEFIPDGDYLDLDNVQKEYVDEL